MRFKIIMAVNTKIVVFLNLTPCKLFRGFFCCFLKQQNLLQTFSADHRKKAINCEEKEGENQQESKISVCKNGPVRKRKGVIRK
jgi:hypothetical protein